MSETETGNEPLHRLVDPPAGRIDRWIAGIADWNSPVLIKEIRQALKSRAFLITYMLLLVAAVGWSVIGLLTAVTSDLENMGGMMLVGYLCILGFPLVIVVPLTAYRSLCREFEEDTLHLVSITTMSPRQLVLGKLASAMAQMVVYLSALAPCVAFTWLLRGIDVFSIALALLLAVVGSAALSSASLFMAAIGRNVTIRTIMFVILLAGLGFTFFMWCAFRGAVESGELGNTSQMIQLHVGFLVGLATTGWLLLEAAASAISFPAENRSTTVRVAMLVQSVALVAMGMGLVGANLPDASIREDVSQLKSQVFFIFVVSACGYWMVMGSLLSGESGVLSSRVRRSLPSTVAGRSFRSLLMPGSGRGYLLAVANMLGWTVAAAVMGWFHFVDPTTLFNSLHSARSFNHQGPDLGFVGLGLVFAVFYLTLTWLLLKLLVAWRVRVTPMLGLVALLIVFTAVNAFSWIAHLLYFVAIGDRFPDGYTTFLIPNVFATFLEFFEGNLMMEQMLALFCFAVGVASVTVACVAVAGRELLDRAVPVPQRVLDELARARRVREEKGESIEDIFARRLSATGSGPSSADG